MVPEPNRSPVRSEAPLTVRWASIWAGDQYIERYGGRLTTSPFSTTSTSMSRPCVAPATRGRASGSGSWPGRSTQAAASASSGVTQCEIEVANDLPRNGPSGTYSQAWMSRADQSLSPTTPKTWSANASYGDRRRRASDGGADDEAQLGLDVEPAAGPNVGASSPAPCAGRSAGRSACPTRRRCRRGRGSRPGGAASWAAAARRRAGRSGRRWWRGRARRRSRRSRRPRTAGAASPRRAAPGAARPGRARSRR